MADTEKMGRFDHMPDPAGDFLIEVECLIGMADSRKRGVDQHPELEGRLRRAMEFRVGGDPHCVAAKETLREIERQLATPLIGLSQGEGVSAWRPFRGPSDVPRNGEWFVARCTKPGWKAVRVVHYADKADRLPIDHTGWVWPALPDEWMSISDFAALSGLSLPGVADLSARVRRLVIAARVVAYSDVQTDMTELDQAAEAFAADIPWENGDDA